MAVKKGAAHPPVGKSTSCVMSDYGVRKGLETRRDMSWVGREAAIGAPFDPLLGQKSEKKARRAHGGGARRAGAPAGRSHSEVAGVAGRSHGKVAWVALVAHVGIHGAGEEVSVGLLGHARVAGQLRGRERDVGCTAMSLQARTSTPIRTPIRTPTPTPSTRAGGSSVVNRNQPQPPHSHHPRAHPHLSRRLLLWDARQRVAAGDRQQPWPGSLDPRPPGRHRRRLG